LPAAGSFKPEGSPKELEQIYLRREDETAVWSSKCLDSVPGLL
jgi:hypothetical protein